MTKQLKDIDYLFISTNLRAREKDLLTAGRMERMIDAPTMEDAAKVLTEIGYSEFSPESEAELGQVLADERDKVFEDLYRFAPDASVVDVFRVKYDYHNAKTVLKARAMGADFNRLLMDAGRMPASQMAAAIVEGRFDALPPAMTEPVKEAAEILSTTGDPQRGDFILDRAYYAEMQELAKKSGSAYLGRYVETAIDAANLRSAVRTLRMKKSGEFLKRVLVEGGAVPCDRILATALGGNLEELYRTTPLKAAAEAGAAAAQGGSLTTFEKLCDDAVTSVLADAKGVAFGPEVVIAFLCAKEIEFTAVRIIMSGRLAGLSGDRIRERLRESYV